jgi:protein-L-isoaspartate O-methyltransferase
MSSRIIEKILEYSRRIFFEEISPKFNKELLKTLMDFLYIIFEKITIKFNFISLNYVKLYSDLVNKEIQMTEVNSKDNILIIGCGTIPSTSILISEKTKAKVVGIDKDKNAIKNANLFLSNINNNKIILKHADGLKYPVNKFDIIMILYGVKNLEGIFDKLYKEVKPDTKIIIRLNEKINKKYFKNFHIIKQIKSKYLGEVYSYLLKK